MSAISRVTATGKREDDGTTRERSFRLTPTGVSARSPRAAGAAGEITLEAGDRVALTGVMSCSREELQARLLSRGYSPWPWVTRNVTLVVAGDLSSTSLKMRRARRYGIPVVDEARLSELLR